MTDPMTPPAQPIPPALTQEYDVAPWGLINLVEIPPPTRMQRVVWWIDEHERAIRFVVLSCIVYWLLARP